MALIGVHLMSNNFTNNERLSMLEVEVKALKDQVNRMDQKLDDLLALRNKGVGVFWLISSLIGTGIVGAFFQLAKWLNGN